MFVAEAPQWRSGAQARGDKTRQFVSVLAFDVEWTKNYRITGGNRPFCYSVVLLQVPLQRFRLDLAPLRFSFKAVYAESLAEEAGLVAQAEADLRAALEQADVVCGHQLTSDLAVLLQASRRSARTVRAIHRLWHRRRDHGELGERRIFDTRYDIDHLVTGESRRLVDVCNELGLGVVQPELRQASMTATYRKYLSAQLEDMRDRLMTLNLRHSVSSALVALLGLNLARRAPLNVNRIVYRCLEPHLSYVRSPAFSELLVES